MMPSGSLWRVLGLCLLSVGAWGQEDNDDPSEPPPQTSASARYKVSISGTTVVLTCPEDLGSESIKWERNGGLLPNEYGEQLFLDGFSEMEDSGYYACYTSNTLEKNYLYLKARVCQNCMEVDLMAVAATIVADVCITLGLLLLVYYWSKNKKASSVTMMRGPGAGGRPRGQNKEKPPPVPNPDYEPIRKGQQDLYSGLNQRGI
ncbi:T-cell surface glycoprotein CD3 epsilon chain [Panthera onca]|uniref:T-cell surface glycoprotein CD3 epsilon chain n=1 Tax=Panthera onca TaxID=9690 RepID=UPI0029547F4F|nr:T-cell surface glycoprotein CD3 epsilon chain [Panthera onca]